MKLSKESNSEHVESGSAGDESVAKPKPLNLKILATLVGFVAGLILALLLSYTIYDSQITQKRLQQLSTLTQDKARVTANQIDEHFANLVSRVSFFANQPLLRNAIVNGDTQSLDANKRSIKSQLKTAETVHIFRAGEVALNPDHVPPIRFSELALLQEAEKGKAANVEAVKWDNQWLLHIIVPARADEDSEPEGVVWVTANLQRVIALLKQDNEGLGKVALYQKFNQKDRPRVASVGDSDLEESAISQIGSTHWEVQFDASSKLFALTHVNTSLVYILVLVLIVVFTLIGAGLGLFVGIKLDVATNKRKMQTQIRTGGAVAADGDGYVDPLYQTKSLFDVDIAKEDESLLGLGDDETEEDGDALSLDDDVFDMDEAGEVAGDSFPEEVFRAYDIRGIADEQISKEFALSLGKAIGSELQELRENTLVVARDARTHSPQLTEWLVRGVLSTGCNVLNIGTVPTPLMYFTLETMEEVSSGVMVTASHNSAEYNGFKIVLGNVSRSGEDIQALRRRMNAKRFMQGQGQEHHHDVVPSYIDTIFSDVALAGEVSVVIDAGNGVAGKVAPQLFEELGCRVTPLHCDLDGTFPNHNPDPSVEENLQDLISKVQADGADIGIALDGDGDRLAVVSPTGKIYWTDRLLMLFATDIISRTPGADVVFDVKSTRHLNSLIANAGGRPVMWKTGHSLMKQKMLETGAVVGAEYSGHVFIKDRWFGFDDGMYAAARLLEILSLQGETIDEAFADFPESLSTPEIRIPVDDTRKFEIIEAIKQHGDFGEGRLTTLDGVRADFAYGWGLIRASNTGPDLTMRFEADDEDSLHSLKSLFVRELRAVDSAIEVDWNQ